MIRTFIAIELSEDVTAALLAEVERLRPQFPRINWVKPDNLHLTIQFLGNLPPDDLPAVFEAAQEAAAASEPFSLTVAGSGVFPDARHPRALYAGCRDGEEAAVSLAGHVSAALSEIGYPADPRRYSPHFTLGRIKQPADALGIESVLPELQARVYGTLEVEELVVFMSELKKQGARHTPMQRIPLGSGR